MRTIKADVLVVGGGPAGLAMSLLLLRSGLSVALAEKSRSLEREYRGEILQPGGQEILHRLGVLRGARERGAYEHDAFRLRQGDRVLLDADYRRLPGPFNCLLSVPQAHMLTELLDACARFDSFTLLSGTRIGALLHEGGRVVGATGGGADGEREVRASVVVGADGRNSKVRRLAGIGTRRQEAFDQDVLWFKLPAPAVAGRRLVEVHRGAGAPVMVYHCHPDRLQVGWTLPHGGYREVAGRGVEHVREEIARAVPEHAEAVRAGIRSLKDVSLLDVFSAQADRWVADGLVLIGDSAHTHGPIGAQGINLALQDAVLLHPLLVAAVRGGDTSAAALSQFERRRRPVIAAVLKLQAMQGRMMLSSNPVATAVRPVMVRAVSHTPLYRKVLHRLAYGPDAPSVRADLFTAEPR
ncbi:FAD-dependent monooxygenase [Streptantibioticus silvisoli]|uniref:FAD-dependent monooxygenase n=1 Tax=Streptantibioticus silvisoli TaxID=2705255 RepID=UPI0027E27305|nr:FAD-dependent monooxygenase [Streptantibioticus silvisoli]